MPILTDDEARELRDETERRKDDDARIAAVVRAELARAQQAEREQANANSLPDPGAGKAFIKELGRKQDEALRARQAEARRQDKEREKLDALDQPYIAARDYQLDQLRQHETHLRQQIAMLTVEAESLVAQQRKLLNVPAGELGKVIGKKK